MDSSKNTPVIIAIILVGALVLGGFFLIQKNFQMQIKELTADQNNEKAVNNERAETSESKPANTVTMETITETSPVPDSQNKKIPSIGFSSDYEKGIHVVNIDNKKIGEITNKEISGAEEGTYIPGIFKQTDKSVYISFIPDGLGGYILYFGPTYMFKLDLDKQIITKLADPEYGYFTDISPDEKLAAYIKTAYIKMVDDTDIKTTDNTDNKHKVLVIRNLESNEITEFPFPSKFGQIGDAIFSPDGQKISLAAAISNPDAESAELFIIDLKSGQTSSISEYNGGIIKVDGWKNNDEISYEFESI